MSSNKYTDCNILKHENVTNELNAKLRRLLNDPTKKQIDFQRCRSLSGTNSSDTDVENQLDINNQEHSAAFLHYKYEYSLLHHRGSPVVTTKPQSSLLSPIGVFWDIENCRVPKGRSAAAVAQVIRNKFFNGYKEAEFIVVCDVNKENKQVIQELNDAQVNLIHVPATYKNAADEKLKQSIRRFADIHGSPAAIILISSDVNFAADLSDLRHRKKLHVILLHNDYSSEALILCANEHYNFMELMEPLPARTPAKVLECHDLLISNLPTQKGLGLIRRRLKILSDNCGGRVIAVNGSTAIIRFSSQDSADRAHKRMNGENVFDSKITVKFLKDKENRRAQENLSLDLASESGTATASPIQMYSVNSSSAGGARSLPSTPYCHSSSPVVGGFSRNWHSIPPPADMMLPAPMFGDRNRHSSNGDFGYNRQYPNASRGHSPNYWHGCGGTTCGPSHHWDDSHRVDRTHQAPTKCIKVPQNRDNSLISGQTPEGMKRIHGSGFNHSKDLNTPRLPYYGMPPAGNNSYNGVNNSQHGCLQRRSPSPFYVNHNCDGGNRWNGQNHSCNQQQQQPPPPPPSSRNQRTPSPFFDTKKHQQQQRVSPYQQSGSESDEIEHFFNPIQHNSTIAHSNGPSIPTELLVTSLDQSIDPKKMKFILGSIFTEHVRVLNISTFVQSDGNYAASVKVPSLQDAQYAISQLHRRRIGYKRILIAYAHTGGPNHQQIRSQIILLLQEVPGHRLPLFKFREMFESRFLTTVSISDLYKMKDVCIISEDPTGRIISLNPDHRNTPSPFLENISENEQVELPYCTVHNKQPWINKGWAEQEMISLPNVTMSLQVLEIRIHQLLKSHNGSLPLPSITTCYEAVFHQPMNVDENGVPLEHLISCLSSVELRQGISSVKFIVLANSQITNDNNNEPIMSPQLITQLSFFSRELVDLLKTAPHCQLLFNRLIPAYHHHFGRQCRVADYGFTKLIDLLDALKQTVQVMGDGNKRIVTLTHRAQARRFTSDLLRILKSQASKQITLSEFPSAYEKVIGKTWNIVDYGVCQMHDILIEVSETTVVVTNINDNDKLLAIPMREQTPEEIEKTKQFSVQVIELLRHAPQCSMLFNKFVPSYHHHFGHQCRVSDYGFSKLIELFEAMPDVVTIEDTNCGEKRISLTEKQSWNVLKDQIVKLISKTNGSIYVSKIPQMYLYDYGYMLRPEQFNCKSILDVLKKLNGIINLIDTQDGIKVELTDVSYSDQIRLQCRRILMEQRDHRLPINVFQHLYKQYYGHSCNFDEIKNNLSDTVEFAFDKNDEFIKLTPIQRFAYNIQKIIINNNGKIHLDMLEITYKKVIGEECNYMKFGYSNLSSLLQSMSYIFIISSTHNKKQVVYLNKKMADFGIELPSIIMSPHSYHSPGNSTHDDNNNNAYNNSMWIKNQNYWDVIKLAGQVGQQQQHQQQQQQESSSSVQSGFYNNDYYSSIYHNEHSISPKTDSSPDSDELAKLKNKKSVWNTPPQRPYDAYDTCIDIPSFTVPQWDDFNDETNLLSPTKNLLPAAANPLNLPNSPFYNDKLQHVIAPHPSELPLPSLALSSKRDKQTNNEGITDSRSLGNSLEIHSPNNSGYYSLSESDSSALLNVTPSKRQLMGKRRLAAQFGSPIDE
ncbi:hypothetical protein HCN44_008324 [Aphidius gifuensis]|uniref:Meiosis regulator and mRNA stability factor 1 n=2 Tax=Aphidius gifuensis TaxID=684658 RepID=A0A834XQF3_APHGI|nr:hypothetical protein HCN44_008324 [Aphidius gifuensis]